MKPKIFERHPCLIQNFLDLTSLGQLREAVDSLFLLHRKGFSLNSKTLAYFMQQCANANAREEGRWAHLHLKITRSKKMGTLLSNHLINMFAKCGDHVKAREVFDKMRARNLYSWNIMLSGYANLGMVNSAKRIFDKMPERDFVSWNSMVMAYVQSGRFNEAILFYIELRRESIGYNEFSFAGVLTVCVKGRKICLTKQLHCQVFLVGFLSNVVLSSSVLNAYAKCGELNDARKMFDEIKGKDVLTWTALISGYAQGGDMESAREIFDSMVEKNPVSWAALISGYVHNGMGCIALKLFSDMIVLRAEPNQFTFSSCFLACGSIPSLEHGRQVHSYLIRSGLRPNPVVLSSVIDMYSRCGAIEIGKRVFDSTQNKQDVVLWNAIITSLCHHGCGQQALKMFVDMVRLGVKPEGITFLALVKACNHSGLVKEGIHLFETMTSDYNIVPDQDHYACLIDLLGRWGCSDEVMNQLKKMPFEPDDRVRNMLLGVCGIQENERRIEKQKGLTWFEIDQRLRSRNGLASCKLYNAENSETSASELLANTSSLCNNRTSNLEGNT